MTTLKINMRYNDQGPIMVINSGNNSELANYAQLEQVYRFINLFILSKDV